MNEWMSTKFDKKVPQAMNARHCIIHECTQCTLMNSNCNEWFEKSIGEWKMFCDVDLNQQTIRKHNHFVELI